MNIISFSLFGTLPLYNLGAIENALMMPKFYPGWLIRFYCSEDAYARKYLKGMPGVEVIEMGNEDLTKAKKGRWRSNIPTLYYGRAWRFLAASDPQAEHVIFRDADARVSEMEVAIVNEWMNSGKEFHIIRDHRHHKAIILSGMWGVKGGIIMNMKELLDSYKKLFVRGGDELFLRDVIWPMANWRCLEHIGLACTGRASGRAYSPNHERIPPHDYTIGGRIEPSKETVEKYGLS